LLRKQSKTFGVHFLPHSVDDSIGNSIYTVMKKAAEDGSIWH